MADLWFLRNVPLHPDDAAKIAPFVNAYRPHCHPKYIPLNPDPHVSKLDLREIMNEGLHINDDDE